jgi:hypothetical protein
MPSPRKPLSLDVLAALGVERLARLVLDEAEASPAFAKRVKAALAALDGPGAVAAMIDKRLAGLERARGFVVDERVRDFTGDLDTLVDIAVDELGAADPAAAIDRLLRFLATAAAVFERIDDRSGRIQGVYHRAVDAIAPLVARLGDDDKAVLPDRLMARLGEDPWGHANDAARAAIQHLPPQVLARFDGQLAEAIAHFAGGPEGDWERRMRRKRLVVLRQAIADHRGDLDSWLALETAEGDGAPDTAEIALRLHEAGRHAEALDWIRRGDPKAARLGVMRWSDQADGLQIRHHGDRARVQLEARILEALGERDAAQALRWDFFMRLLDVEMLRAHVARLPDFAEFETLDRAFAHAARHADIHRALELFLAWPRLDLAARHVLAHRERWEGRHYGALAPAAAALATDHADAATILYRALLEDILRRAQSSAYTHAAEYLAQLDALGPRLSPDAGLGDHATYRAALTKAHARKPAFWARVRERPN